MFGKHGAVKLMFFVNMSCVFYRLLKYPVSEKRFGGFTFFTLSCDVFTENFPDRNSETILAFP